MNRYSAKLLFQYRADLGRGRSDVMRRCEERIVIITAKNAKSALRKAKTYGKREEFDGNAEAGNPLHFEFVGIMDLLELGVETQPEEVWYDIVVRKQPSERREKLIPEESRLNAIYWERQRNQKPNNIAAGSRPSAGQLADNR